ncbi:hypothetical protein CROQUDRAFT_665689 [Cronartium quercuum f. sp. fusiforme G11]|uniref:Uncharacterized protein n=1 Tax=Cronartium quercuum f. sp. fusiforme G11 TaxID=708437 RepID=A0A9P6NA15_9BASI|nr:hypothetical protein CROQUDRAFT_665689 [Cronartium quercuum f. sp. fusiforme G11]
MYERAQVHYGLAQQRPDEDDWEPPQLDGLPELDDIRRQISLLEEEHRSRGKVNLTGHVIMACHALPYICSLHSSADGPEPPQPTTDETLEIRPGDVRTMPRSLHSPTTTPTAMTENGSCSGSSVAEESNKRLSAARLQPLSTAKPASLLDQPKPQASSRPGTPAYPGPPSSAGLSSGESPATVPADEERFKWVLEPRPGHAALNAGIKSLSSYRTITLCAYPANLSLAGTHPLDASKLTDAQTHGLDAGLRSLARGEAEQGGRKGIECVPVWVEERMAGLHYEGFCKKYLWPIFHYMPLSEHQDKVLENMAWKAYEAVNSAFAQKIVEIYRPGDLIWIQDYHLLLVPRMLRKMLPKAYIGLFLHSPFPSSEFFRCLPRREEILDGMLGSDLLCFQTYSYGRHFVSACIRVMGYESIGGGIEANGRHTSITHCPIGIDANRIESDRKMPGVKPKMEALKKLYEGKKIIVGRDKLDPTKGVLPKLRAFEELLKRFPQWRNQVVLIQVTSPSPTDSPQLATKISELVDHINATYGTLHFQPVHHYHQTIERDEYFALLSVADLAVITSVRDGMNTTSMEYTICQKEYKNPLILSEFTGVTGSMKAAIKINPWDLGGVAKAIDQCLSMPEAEKKQRHAQLYSRVKSHSSAVWASTLLLQLLDCLRSDQAQQSVKLLDEARLMKEYNEAEKRLLVFDYDGTLTPIVKIPKDAIPLPGLIGALEKLCADEKNIVYIISGRDGAFLQEHLGGIKGLGMSAEHGCYLREPGMEDWIDLTGDIEMEWMNDVEEIFKYYEARTLGAMVEKKTSSVTWHYRNADPEFGLFQAKELQALLESMQERMPIDILKGKKNIECRPAHTNKGEIVKRLLYTTPEIGFAFCAGDDKTDEDMFRALKQMMRTGGRSEIEAPLFPTLTRTSSTGSGTGPVVCELEADGIFAVVIDENESRKTLADFRLERPQGLIEVLIKLANV